MRPSTFTSGPTCKPAVIFDINSYVIRSQWKVLFDVTAEVRDGISNGDIEYNGKQPLGL